MTEAWHWPGSVLRVWLAGQVMVGRWVSFTVTVKVHRLVRPAPSVTSHTTEVAPFGKGEPLGRLGGTGAALAPGQLSEYVGVG